MNVAAAVEAGDRIHVAPIREAFERSGRTAADVAEGLGMSKRVGRRVQGDSTRLLRLLGLKPYGQCRPAETIAYELAVAVARELCVDPRDVGL